MDKYFHGCPCCGVMIRYDGLSKEDVRILGDLLTWLDKREIEITHIERRSYRSTGRSICEIVVKDGNYVKKYKGYAYVCDTDEYSPSIGMNIATMRAVVACVEDIR
jgi:hypothetical protein